jgi:hypothetical protein
MGKTSVNKYGADMITITYQYDTFTQEAQPKRRKDIEKVLRQMISTRNRWLRDPAKDTALCEESQQHPGRKILSVHLPAI